MDKLKMQSKNLVNENIDKIASMFPNCITEGRNDNGELVKMVDFDLLKQELSHIVVEGDQERYTMNWPDKKQAILTANAPINKTLRPCEEESVGKDGTPGKFDSENLYIEGDNLDVLKLLRETYLGKIKMIYIDPPYNTGNDFVYNDDFATSTDDYLERSNQVDEEGNRMVLNNDSNGRFHTDWLNMIYPRLKLARDLLTDDGVIFISIDFNEISNLKKICDEIFGESNFVNLYNRVTKKSSNSGNNFSPCVDYALIYSKNILCIPEYTVEMTDDIIERYNKSDEYEYERGKYQEVGLFMSALKHGGSNYPIECPDGTFAYPPNKQPWRWNEETFLKGKSEGRIVFKKTDHSPLIDLVTGKNSAWNIYTKVYLNERAEKGMHPKNFSEEFQNTLATNELRKLNINFDFAKPTNFVKFLTSLQSDRNSIILDFFSGSATTAHAVMQLNAEDCGNRKFILVQLPEVCDEKSEAYKAGYKNICEIGKERIRRAGKKIQEENRMTAPNLDIGFRVLKLDDSNMKDVYYSPSDYTQDLLTRLESNIKEDRTPEDLLFQVMLDMGVSLSAKIEKIELSSKTLYNVNDGDLVCCFDKNLTDEEVTQIAKLKPLYAVFRDSSLTSDSTSANFDQIFATYSPSTDRRVL